MTDQLYRISHHQVKWETDIALGAVAPYATRRDRELITAMGKHAPGLNVLDNSGRVPKLLAA